MKCIVLAFSNLKDLPQNHTAFELIDCYGEIDCNDFDPTSINSNIVIHRELFAIGKNIIPETPYNAGFIRHPDPWGEPRNWIQAIAALGECLQGNLTCEFWYPHEIIAFHFLLVSLLSQEQVRFLHAEQTADSNDWDNFSASWKINAISLQSDMLDHYQKEKQTLLERFYNQIGKFYREISLEEAINIIHQLN